MLVTDVKNEKTAVLRAVCSSSVILVSSDSQTIFVINGSSFFTAFE
jgi:hypothetical protein